MKRAPTAEHAAASLTHPLAIGAMLTLALNALLLQPNWPSWWTGKIGDAAWLAFAPHLAAAGLALLLPRRFERRNRLLGLSAVLLTGAGFAAVKALPAVNHLAVAAFDRISFPAKLALDPTDLVALPGLLVAWWTWTKAERKSASRLRRFFAISFAMLAVVADSAGPQDRGVVCLAKDGDVLYATSEVNEYAYFNSRVLKSVYRSEDGGLTWVFEEVRTGELSTKSVATPTPEPNSPPSSYCEKLIWPVYEAADTQVQYFGIDRKGIYRSEDGGATLKLENEFPDPIYGALIHSPTGNVVVAAGRSGVLTRTPAGEWQTTILTNETP
ncbi:MAG TPA: hypothetical protein VJ020_06855 [Anaerolineales bacterium]|nr:hypothetical protein [Anaerolineales bacterium]